jgi:hypothetical protein
MPKTYTFAPKLKLVADHLKAIRTLDEYVNGVGLKKDMQDFSNYLQQDLSRDVFRPAGWEDLYTEDGALYSSPKSSGPRSTWRVVKGDFIAVEIYPAWPVQDEEPFVNLYVPADWKKRLQFLAKLKPPEGFEHFNQYSEGELEKTVSIIKFLPYTNYVGADGSFDSTGFLDAFREAAKTLVAMEKVIEVILESIA